MWKEAQLLLWLCYSENDASQMEHWDFPFVLASLGFRSTFTYQEVFSLQKAFCAALLSPGGQVKPLIRCRSRATAQQEQAQVSGDICEETAPSSGSNHSGTSMELQTICWNPHFCIRWKKKETLTNDLHIQRWYRSMFLIYKWLLIWSLLIRTDYKKCVTVKERAGPSTDSEKVQWVDPLQIILKPVQQYTKC